MSEVFKLSNIPNRIGLADFLNRHGLTNAGAEIGVWLGHFSVPFLDRWEGKRLYLVDPWEKLPQEEYDDVRNRDFDPEDYNRARAEVGNLAGGQSCVG